MTDDELRRALAEAAYLPPHGHAVSRLLPVVTAYARERAAEELGRMADWIDGEAGATVTVWPSLGLRNRAADLAADDRTGQR